MTAPARSIPADDRGLLLGDGLFETLLAVDGRLVLFEAHAARMRIGAEALGLEAPSTEALRQVADAALATAGLEAGRAAVRITLTAGSGGRGLDRPRPTSPRLFATASPSLRPVQPVSAVVVEIRRNERSPASRLKTLAYLDNVLARREAQAAGAEEALMLNTAGRLACAAAANLFWIADGCLYTPALECGVLDGIVRRVLLARAGDCGLRAREVGMGPEALDDAEAVFLSNSLIGVRPVRRVGDRAIGHSETADRLARAVAAEIS